MKVFVVGILMVAVLGCDKKSSGGSSASSDPVKATVAAQSSELDLEVSRLVDLDTDKIKDVDSDYYNRFKDGINKRLLKVTAKDGKALPSDLVLDCKGLGGFLKQEPSPANAQVVLDLTDVASDNLELECQLMRGQEQILTKSMKLKKDLLFPGANINHLLSSKREEKINEFDHVILLANARLLVGDRNLKIKADTFFSDNAVIQTFDGRELTAMQNDAGRSGGDVKILTQRSFGHLRVVLKGQDGGANIEDDEFNYVSDQFVTKLHKNSGIGCTKGQYLVEFKPRRDVTGRSGGDSGSFTHKSKEGDLIVDIEASAGLGGPGALSYLASKDNVIRGTLHILPKTKFIALTSIGLMQPYEKHKKVDFAHCGDISPRCVQVLENGTREERDKFWHKKAGWICKAPMNGYYNYQTQGTNYHYNELVLEVGHFKSLTRGNDGLDGQTCTVRSGSGSDSCSF